jgi:hypothetical protein
LIYTRLDQKGQNGNPDSTGKKKRRHNLTLRCAVTVPVLFCLIQASVQAETRPLELKWGELAATVQGHSAELTLTGGTSVTGDVAAIRDDAMVLDVKKTSDARAYPKGNASIPRGSIQLVKLKRSGSWGKTLGITLGVLSGVAVGGYVAGSTQNSAGPGVAVFLVIAGAMSVGGYLLGRRADQRATTIRIVP